MDRSNIPNFFLIFKQFCRTDSGLKDQVPQCNDKKKQDYLHFFVFMQLMIETGIEVKTERKLSECVENTSSHALFDLVNYYLKGQFLVSFNP